MLTWQVAVVLILPTSNVWYLLPSHIWSVGRGQRALEHGAVPAGQAGRHVRAERAVRVHGGAVPDARAPPPAGRVLHAGPAGRRAGPAHAAAGNASPALSHQGQHFLWASRRGVLRSDGALSP